MNRRNFVRGSLVSSFALATVRTRAIERTSSTEIASPPAFELDEMTIGELQSGMASGKYTSHSITRKYLDRIDDIDKHGPAINSIIELNPDALSIATALDRERKVGRRGG